MARARVSQLRDPAAIEAWLARICVHRSFRVRKRGPATPGAPRRHAVPSRHASPDGPAGAQGAGGALPPRDRAVVVLQHGYGYSLDEVAALVGVSHANARKISSRTRARLLRAWLEAEA